MGIWQPPGRSEGMQAVVLRAGGWVTGPGVRKGGAPWASSSRLWPVVESGPPGLEHFNPSVNKD